MLELSETMETVEKAVYEGRCFTAFHKTTEGMPATPQDVETCATSCNELAQQVLADMKVCTALFTTLPQYQFRSSSKDAEPSKDAAAKMF